MSLSSSEVETSALNGYEWSASCYSYFILGEDSFCPFDRRLAEPKSFLTWWLREKSLSLPPGIKL